MNKKILRPIQGAIFAIGAPLGWLTVRYFNDADITLELEDNWGLYAYMLFSTLSVFTLFGAYVGRQEQKITELASRDALTGICNLRSFIERLHQEISRAKRHSIPLSIIYFDLDYFKRVNDRYGHPAGDLVLKEISQQVKKITREHDIFARVGGEEFCILLPRCQLGDAVAHAERIRSTIEALQIKLSHGEKIKVTVSVGVVSWHTEESVNEFYKRADEKLYLAKQRGRNRVES